MPQNKSASMRYRIIDSCLTNKRRPCPTLEDLARICSEKLDREISTSTIEKDLRAMKSPFPEGYDAPIVYDKERRGYRYAEEGFSIGEIDLEEDEWHSLRYAARLLYQYADVPLFRDFKQAIEKIDARFNLQLDPEDSDLSRFIQFETGTSFTGYEWIGVMVRAIPSKWLLRLEYENIYKKEVKRYNVVPYLLKEHRNRWYLIGWVEERGDYLTFALDRIRDVETVEERQKARQDFQPDRFLTHAVGIMEGDGQPDEVELRLSGPHLRLLQLEPLHPSQQILRADDTAMHVSLCVFPNAELCNRILSMGPHCEVIRPLSLRSRISALLDETKALYAPADRAAD